MNSCGLRFDTVMRLLFQFPQDEEAIFESLKNGNIQSSMSTSVLSHTFTPSVNATSEPTPMVTDANQCKYLNAQFVPSSQLTQGVSNILF